MPTNLHTTRAERRERNDQRAETASRIFCTAMGRRQVELARRAVAEATTPQEVNRNRRALNVLLAMDAIRDASESVELDSEGRYIPTLLEIAGVEFSQSEIMLPVVSMVQVNLYDAGYGRRTRVRTRKHELIYNPSGYRLKCDRIYPCHDRATNTFYSVRVVRRTKFNFNGNYYYKFERVG